MALNINRILVGVDDSEDALTAFDYAINLAKQFHAELYIVSILEDEDINVFQSMDKDYIHGERVALEKHVLKYQKQAQDAGVDDVHSIVSEGNPSEVIVEEVIPSVNPDLVVIGAEAKKGLQRHFGSHAAYIAKYSPKTVTVVR